MNISRDLSRNSPATTTPVNYRDANAVYRSLSAAPAPLDVSRSAVHQPPFGGKLAGPQSKGHGQVVYSEEKHVKSPQAEGQPCPIPLIVANAPSNALFVESNPVSKVVTAVHELFQHHQVDVQFHSAKFKWKCLCYAGETETRFVARLFSIPSKVNFFVLDFQRRSGDPFHFQSIYKAINFRLLKSGFIVCNDNQSELKVEEPVFRTFKPLALPDCFYDEETPDESPGPDLDPLFRMCDSPFIDVQREGLAALATQLASSEPSRNAARSFVGKLLEMVSLAKDVQVRRLATSAVSKLAGDNEINRKIATLGGVRVLVNILLNADEMLETRRHTAVALLKIEDLDPQSISLISCAAATPDARLNELLKQLGEARRA